MDEQKRSECRCEKTACGCTRAGVERCTCGERCACTGTCRCDRGCACAAAG